jgi:hypothetical protein
MAASTAAARAAGRIVVLIHGHRVAARTGADAERRSAVIAARHRAAAAAPRAVPLGIVGTLARIRHESVS